MTKSLSLVRLDPIPLPSFDLRAYREPGDPLVSLADEMREYILAGRVCIEGTIATITATHGAIPGKAGWRDLSAALAALGAKEMRWERRKNGNTIYVARKIKQ